MELTRDLISFNLYLIFYLPRYNVFHLIISHCLFFSPLFTLSRLFLFYVLSPGLLCRRLESFSRAFSFTPVPFVSISLYLSLFLLFYFIFFIVSISHSPIHVSHSHIRLSQMSASYLKRNYFIYVSHSLSRSRTRPTAKRQMAKVTYRKEIIIPQNELATC